MKIGTGAFYDCNSLKKIKIPDTVMIIGKDAFRVCNNLSEAVVPRNLKIDSAFMKKTKIIRRE